MAVKLPDTLVPMADFPSAFAKDVQFTDGENLQDKLDNGKLGSSSSGTGLTEEQANNIEKIPSIEGIVTSNSQAIINKADKDHEHTEYLKEIPDEYVIDTELSTELDKKVNKEVGKGLSTNDLTDELVIKINSSATEAFVTNAIANAQLDGGDVDLSGYATVDALNLKADLTHTHDQYLTEVPDEYITETELTDKNYADKEYVTQAVSNVNVDLTEYAKTSDIPTKVSQLTNDSNFITTIPEEYITETELANELSTRNVKTYTNITQLGLTAPVITGKIYNALPENSIFQCEITDNKTVSDTPEATGILTIQKSSKRLAIEFKACARYSVYPNNLYLGQLKGDDGSGITWNKVALSSDLEGCVTDTELSSKGYATETFVTNKITEASLSGSGVDLSGYATKDDVPTKTSELTNDSGFITSDDLPTVPTKVSDLANDSNFVTNSKMLEAMADLILDTEVRIDKTYSSSKIYTDIQQCLEDSKTYTLEELGKKIGASYEIVTSTDDMVSQERLYLLNNGNNYDIYIVDVDNVPVVIGDTSIDLSGYVTKTEIESELGTERLGTTSQTVKGAINELFQSVTNEGDLTDIENRLSKLEAIRHYNSIEELGLDLTANINDIITAMNNNTTFTYSSNMFDITEYNNVNYGTVLINKLSSSRVQVLMTDKYTGDLYVGKINNSNQFDGWIKNNTVNTTDLTEINDKITQLENKQIKNINLIDMNGNAPIYKIKPSGTNHISKISMVDLYGGCILITGSAVSSEYKPFKVVRLSNGNWESYYPSLTGANKINSVYYDGSFIYVKCNNYIKCYIDGGFDTVEKITSLPTGVTELPILDLTQRSTVDLTDINDRLTQLENTTSGGNTNNDVYSTEEQAIGTWVGGQTLYRRTISNNTGLTVNDTLHHNVILNLNSNTNVVVKMEGVVRIAGSNGTDVSAYPLPYNNKTLGYLIRLECPQSNRVIIHYTDCKDVIIKGFDVSIYYYKK